MNKIRLAYIGCRAAVDRGYLPLILNIDSGSAQTPFFQALDIQLASR